MKTMLERFTIIDMQGRKTTLDVPIKDNTLVLVGENGSGKTTFLRILFHFLSGKWLVLANFKFKSITAVVGGETFTVNHADLAEASKRVDKRAMAFLPGALRRRVLEFVSRGDYDRASYEIERSGFRTHVPTPIFVRQLALFEESSRVSSKELTKLIERFREAIGAQILYLPTYRRIERELSSIFEDSDFDDLRKARARSQQSGENAYIELVEFGMKDVQAAIDRTLDKLKEFAREGLNKLTLSYLGDVVNRQYDQIGMDDISNVSEDTLKAVVARIDDSVLTAAHKSHLVETIRGASTAESSSEHKKIMYHYFLMLANFQQSLHEEEQQITEFCGVCSNYIVDKKFTYDSSKFSFQITTELAPGVESTLDISELSSGEKQIVSLFSHLYLSGKKQFFVLIDEPELSLSVPWQRRFLTDIHQGIFCEGLIAVTHSPFIHDNYLRAYTHALGEFSSV